MKFRLIAGLLALLLLLTACGGQEGSGKGAWERYLGGDVSSLMEVEENGRVFRNGEGEETDVFALLTEGGMDSVRIRLWNDPVDEFGVPYNDGHNDLATAIAIGQRATAAGMRVFLDFHYSDHWADPAQQKAPRAWAGMGLEEKRQALYDFTRESLQALLDAGVNVTMVQVGNETTSGLAGETEWEAITTLMKAGLQAVRDTARDHDREILTALHFTGWEGYEWYAGRLAEYEVEYDVFAASYYPYWHGTVEEQAGALAQVAECYGKKVVIAEFAYPYGAYDLDGHFNSVGTGLDFPYPLTPEGQEEALRDALGLLDALGDRCLGFFYWEPAWIGYQGPNGAGSPWENQALFDAGGKPLPALALFREKQK